jgi:hypothetical protein
MTPAVSDRNGDFPSQSNTAEILGDGIKQHTVQPRARELLVLQLWLSRPGILASAIQYPRALIR